MDEPIRLQVKGSWKWTDASHPLTIRNLTIKSKKDEFGGPSNDEYILTLSNAGANHLAGTRRFSGS
jgi:hypothetical protein